MKKFIIVGSGWRASFYARIAKALPERFTLCAMLCRSEEKALKMSSELEIHTTTSVSECESYHPDFVVVAVNKDNIFSVSKEWLGKGFTVMCETPAALCMENLNELWQMHLKGAKLLVSEQYLFYPRYAAVKKVLDSGLIGKRLNANVSLAHDYHGASLIRGFLGISDERFTVIGKSFSYPVVETESRYEKFYDGRIANKKRDVLIFEFTSGKTAVYDFNSVQYRSTIRKNHLSVQGIKGEVNDFEVSYLDESFIPHCEKIEISDSGFENCGLTEDEIAIATLMENVDVPVYSLKDALTDAYMAILMKEAVENHGKEVVSEKQIWMD